MEQKQKVLATQKPLTGRSYSESESTVDVSKYMPFLRGRQFQKAKDGKQ